MKPTFWLASYPKSGNTWFRIVAANLWSERDTPIDINLIGSWNTVTAALPSMLAADNGGSIILTSSASGLKAIPWTLAYTASKFGITGMTKSFAMELAKDKIRVNSVLPGPIRTRAWDNVSEDDVRRSVEQTVAGRLGEPDEVAAAIAFLLSSDASYITGTTLLVDGGWTSYKTSA